MVYREGPSATAIISIPAGLSYNGTPGPLTVELRIAKMDNGIEVVATSAGEKKVSVKVDGRHVIGSPLSIHVVPAGV